LHVEESLSANAKRFGASIAENLLKLRLLIRRDFVRANVMRLAENAEK
jgi:hypothetical protein